MPDFFFLRTIRKAGIFKVLTNNLDVRWKKKKRRPSFLAIKFESQDLDPPPRRLLLFFISTNLKYSLSRKEVRVA